MTDTRQRFQGTCLQSTEGFYWMNTFDALYPEVRERLRNSPFNICTVCVAGMAYKIGGKKSVKIKFMEAITRMEEMIRAGN